MHIHVTQGSAQKIKSGGNVGWRVMRKKLTFEVIDILVIIILHQIREKS